MNFKEVVKRRDKSAAYFGAAGKRYFICSYVSGGSFTFTFFK